VAALVVAGFLAAFGGLHYGFYTRRLLMDTPVYERYGDAIVHGSELPYRDFAVEYPPGALPVFAAPSLGAAAGDFHQYSRLFEVLMLVCGATAAALTGFLLSLQRAGIPRLVGGTLLAGLAPLALGPVVLSRFDLWPAALTIAAVAAAAAGRVRLGFGVLGGAIVAKLYPAVILPLALAYVWRRNGPRQAAVCAAIATIVVGACLLPFVVAAPDRVWSSFEGQASRPLQIESLGASFLLAAHQVWGAPLREVSSNGSDNLVGGVPHAFAIAQTLLVVAALVAIWIAFARGPATRDRFLRYGAAAICAFVALGKVLSPQYLIWLMALIPLVRGRRGAVAAGLFIASMVLTQLWFPSRYISLVYGIEPRASWLVFARDVVLVALLVTLVWPRRRAPRIGVSLVAALVLVGAAAVGAAFATSGPGGRTHSGLLNETGVPSTCRTAKGAPATTSGAVRYESTSFSSRGPGRRCVTVVLKTKPHVQLFSAAYRRSLDPSDPRANYLGDAGICTNIAGATGSTTSYSFTIPSRRRFMVDVEPCASSSLSLYTLEVLSGSALRYVSASARQTRAAVVVRWRTTTNPRGVSFTVYRELKDERVLAAVVGDAHSYFDRQASPDRSLRYWIRASERAGGWSWYGPISVGSTHAT